MRDAVQQKVIEMLLFMQHLFNFLTLGYRWLQLINPLSHFLQFIDQLFLCLLLIFHIRYLKSLTELRLQFPRIISSPLLKIKTGRPFAGRPYIVV